MPGLKLIALSLLAAGFAPFASAQRPPPPRVIPPAETRPSLINNKLDMSFCEYPVAAIRKDIEGCCRMKVSIGADGTAGPMSGECTNDIFLEPSKACLVPQAYRPARRAGKAVAGTGDIVVEYRLTYSEPPAVIGFLEKLFPSLKRERPQREEDDICKRRPDDLIAALSHYRAG